MRILSREKKCQIIKFEDMDLDSGYDFKLVFDESLFSRLLKFSLARRKNKLSFLFVTNSPISDCILKLEGMIIVDYKL